MKYKIGVTLVIEDYLIEDVEADSAEEAEEKAGQQASNRWDVMRTETQVITEVLNEEK